ncbi:hypothetical protein C3Y87_20365 [Carbonactinospora thermoautotrophica]|uniref:DUF6542 domain-containing protein n=2 Tax=Carbonactinospora thermoautotrophica TaxID=1469144 RepID=A0A132N4N1_9ACTN|nr:DUF6542 domain-containing protein [Carbonactinospora thermoautotrophica]KWX04987.1 hypothetical protein TH66_04245 [Carbonactinospora thermoautotrophica]MCX9193692.1 hypothetical protein [Carbonactinospora thermoautotrophica]
MAERRAASGGEEYEGLNWAGAALLFFVITGLAALADAAITGQLKWIFYASFLVCCVYVALHLRHEDLLAGINIPPIAFVLIAFISLQFSDHGQDSWLTRQVLGMSNFLALNAPVLLFGYAVAALIVLLRWRRRRTRPARESRTRVAAAPRTPERRARARR